MEFACTLFKWLIYTDIWFDFWSIQISELCFWEVIEVFTRYYQTCKSSTFSLEFSLWLFHFDIDGGYK